MLAQFVCEPFVFLAEVAVRNHFITDCHFAIYCLTQGTTAELGLGPTQAFLASHRKRFGSVPVEDGSVGPYWCLVGHAIALMQEVNSDS